MLETYKSWGQYPVAEQKVRPMYWRTDTLPLNGSVLPYGQGRSYGDVCLNDGGAIIPTQYLNRFISFDSERGILKCESGVTLADILRLTTPHGWFPTVTPGTKFVSVGGAIANDVHGKNHHRAGTFGCHVTQFELLRSSGERLICSPSQNIELYRATIGGLGLTGLITWAEIQLKPINGLYLDAESVKMNNIDEFFDLSSESDRTYEYTVSWIDTTATGKHIGRGLFMRGNHYSDAKRGQVPFLKVPDPLLTLPLNAPNWFLNIPLIKTFNFIYYNQQVQKRVQRRIHYDPFFYPLDKIQYWNRLYGKRGFQSFQCMVPREYGKKAIHEILTTVHDSGFASPLTVLKLFGNKKSPGILSFPQPGVNILLDFPNVGTQLSVLLQTLDNITRECGGRVNPAKDAHMSSEHFQTFYPEWREFSQYVDPIFSSSFWRRVTQTK